MSHPITLNPGDRFAMLTVVERAAGPNRGIYYHCRCDCGAERVVRGANLRLGYTKSCGCATVAMRLAAVEAEADEDAPLLPRLVPSSWLDDPVLIGRLLVALDLPLDELSFLPPTSIADVAARVGVEPHQLNRPVLRRWLEWNGERVWGRRIAAGDVFGERQCVFTERSAA